MEDEMKEFYNTNASPLKLKSLKVGQLVAVKAEEEEAWLRAQILSLEENKIKVFSFSWLLYYAFKEVNREGAYKCHKNNSDGSIGHRQCISIIYILFPSFIGLDSCQIIRLYRLTGGHRSGTPKLQLELVFLATRQSALPTRCRFLHPGLGASIWCNVHMYSTACCSF